MTPDLVIFDCDGVLVDTEGPVAEVLAANLARHGLSVTAREILDLFQGGTLAGAGKLAEERGAKLPADWLDTTYAEIFARLEQGVPVIDGVPEFLDALDARGIATCVASNGPMRKMQISLGPSGLYDRFEGRLFSAHEVGAAKPDPALLFAATEAAGVAADRAVMIDDSPAGCIAARRAGIRCFGFAEATDPARLEPEGAEIVRSMDEIAQALLGRSLFAAA